MIKGIGIDSLEIYRMEKAIIRHGNKFSKKIFTLQEWEYCQKSSRPAASLAARFAAKEAVVKVLGADWRYLRWKEIEVLSEKGRPSLKIYGGTFLEAKNKGITTWHVSLTHDKERAIAVVLAE